MVPVAMLIVPAPPVVVCEMAAYVAKETGAGVRPERYDVGAPQLELNVAVEALRVAGQLAPPKPFAGVVDDPSQEASVTSVQEDEPGVLPVPAAHATQALDVVAVAPPREYVLEPHALVVPEPWPAAHQ